MQAITTEHAAKLLDCVGRDVTVHTDDHYYATGRLIGLMRDVDGPKIRVLGRDRLERRIPLPVQVTVHAR